MLIASLYYLFRCLSLTKAENKLKLIALGAVIFLIGITTAAIQLLPTAELLKYSIRNLDRNIVDYHYGLLPVQNLLSFLAPDFFGNPATGNYWGAIQYQEATGYFSAIALALAILGIFFKKRSWRLNLFSALFIGSIVLAFNNPISRLIYQLKIPLLSTGYASRWLIITAFSGAFLAATAIERLNRKNLALILSLMLGILVLIYGVIWKAVIPTDPTLIPIITRNLLLPIALLFAGITVCIIIKNKNWAKWLLLALVAFDLGRFTIKFTPFSEPEYTSRAIPVFEYIKSQTNIDRVINDYDAILPANTWMYPKLYSPAGYDPLLIKDYAIFFRGLSMGQAETVRPGELDEGNFTRYLNVVNLKSPLLDLVGAKYLLAEKYDRYGKIRPWGNINEGAIDLARYKPVFEDGASVVLQNQTALPRASLYYKAESETDSVKAVEKLVLGFDFRNKLLINKVNPTQYTPGENDTLEITDYSANKVDFKAKTQNGAYLFLSDTFFPGWKVFTNGKSGEILLADSVFRAVEVPPGDSRIEMVYSPNSYKTGVVISIFSLTILLILIFKVKEERG
ncbi:MAG: YfhO family protein [Candidatus Woesebacteria bacterium]|nr:YfhO family protein [Candidatus Woesebacteria bacterium]